jgi:type IV pilus biogenesis protein CpaD/CtpE
VKRTQTFVRASLLCTVAFAAAAMLSGCARNDDAGRASLASAQKTEPVLVAQATSDGDMPEVVIRASRDTGRAERL